MELMGVRGKYPVAMGAAVGMKDEQTPVDSEGARLIIEEAMKEDDRPLYIACQGAVTDIASALLIEPGIAERLTIIWIGGGDYPKGVQSGYGYPCRQCDLLVESAPVADPDESIQDVCGFSGGAAA